MKMTHQKVLSVVAASILCGSLAFGGATDYNASVAIPYQVGSGKDTNTTIVFKGDQGVKVENVYIDLNNSTAADYNLTSGNKLFIQLLDEKLHFAEAPIAVAGTNMFAVNGQPAHRKATEIVTDPDTNCERAIITVDSNVSNNIKFSFENIKLNIPADYSGNEINVTFGSITNSFYVSKNSVKPLVAKVYSSFAKNPIIAVDGDAASDDNTPVVMPREAGETNSSTFADDKTITMLFKVAADMPSGSVIDLNLPSWAKMIKYPTVGLLTDTKKIDYTNIDANATDVGSVTVSGTDNNNTIRLTLSNATKEVTEVNFSIKLSDLNITTTQEDGAKLDVTINGNATLVDAPSIFTLAELKSKGLIIDVNESADRNITKGALYAAPLNPIVIKTNFSHDWNDTNVTVMLPANVKVGDLNLTSATTLPVTVKDDSGNPIGTTTLLQAIPSSKIGSDLRSFELNLSVFDGNTSITVEVNTSVANIFAQNKVPVTLELTKAGDSIILRDLPAVTASNGANVVDPEVSVETNETDKRVGIGSTNILRLEVNETHYGSLQMINNASTRYFVRSVSCAKINESGTNNAFRGATNGLALGSGVSIDDSTYRYTLTNESKGTGDNVYADLNITIPDSCQVGDEVKVKFEREDGLVIGEVKLATVGKPVDIEAVEQNVTIANKVEPQVLGTINIKEELAGGLTDGGAFTILVPAGMEDAKAEVTGTGITIETNSTGLNNRAVIAKVGTALVDANITIYAEVGNLSGAQAVEIKDGNISDNYSNKANIPEKSVTLTYVSVDGNIPAPTLTANGNTEIPAGTEANITLTCTSNTGLGSTTITFDNSNGAHISLVDGNIIHVSADATAGEEANATCKETLGGKESPASNPVIVKVINPTVSGTLTLVQGKWNLITTPVPANMPKSELDAYTSKTVWAFDPNIWNYVKVTSEIEVGKGYWVRADKQGGTLTYSTVPTVADKAAQWTLIQNNLVAGKWNLVGTSFDTTKTEVKSALGVNTIWLYDPNINNYTNVENISAGTGMWVK